LLSTSKVRYFLPQVAEIDTPQTSDAFGEYPLYDKYMTRVFVADGNREERLAFRLLLLDLKMEVVGEATDWATTLTNAPTCRLDVLLIDWNLLPRSIPNTALDALRRVCPAAMVIVLISQLDARQQAAILSGADVFISKGESPERVAQRLRFVAASIHP
jgi:DNA-binding NarL/FixJ family response regulator